MKKVILTIAAMISCQAFTQSIEIISMPDTVLINSNAPQQLVEVFFVNHSTNYRTVAVMETPVDPLPGVTDTIGFFNVLSPYPGEPETLTIEPLDTSRAFYYFTPNGSTGSHTINICLWDYYNQSDTTCIQTTIKTTTMASTNELMNPQISVYPNPVSDHLNFNCMGCKTSNIKIVDISGNEVFNSRGNFVLIDGVFNIDGQSWPPGVYFAILYDDSKVYYTVKIIKT